MPPKIFIAKTAAYLLWPRGDEQDHAYLLAVLCSIPLDWYARRFVETHVNYFVFNPFPAPRPLRGEKRWQRVVALAGRLAAPDRRFASWAKAVGVEHGVLQDGVKQDMIAELDAVVVHLYGLSSGRAMGIKLALRFRLSKVEPLDSMRARFNTPRVASIESLR